MKKIVLAAINAKYIHSNLAVYSLKANAGKYEEDIELAEYTILPRSIALEQAQGKAGPRKHPLHR